MSSEQNTNETRIAALEVSVKGIAKQVNQMSEDFSSFASEVRKTISDSNKSKQWNLGTIIQISSFLVTTISAVIIGIVWLSTSISNQKTLQLEALSGFNIKNLSKLQEKFDEHKSNHGHPKIIADLARMESSIQERFKEIETQLIMSSHIHNLQNQKTRNIQRMLWSEAFQTKNYPMSGDDYYPVVGNYDVSPGYMK